MNPNWDSNLGPPESRLGLNFFYFEADIGIQKAQILRLVLLNNVICMGSVTAFQVADQFSGRDYIYILFSGHTAL